MSGWRAAPVKVAVVGSILAASIVPLTGRAHADGVNWEAIAQCESGGNWSADTGNGDYGGLQISKATWEANGGVGLPSKASPQQQIQVGQRILAKEGPSAWPKCSPCSQNKAPVGSLTHMLTFMWGQTGGCPGSSRAVEEERT